MLENEYQQSPKAAGGGKQEIELARHDTAVQIQAQIEMKEAELQHTVNLRDFRQAVGIEDSIQELKEDLKRAEDKKEEKRKEREAQKAAAQQLETEVRQEFAALTKEITANIASTEKDIAAGS